MVNTTDILPNTPRYLKAPLIFFNVILWILGIILIAIGGVALDALKKISGLESISLPAGLIVLGVFLIILTVVGCVVAYKEKLVGLIFYTVLILILLICLIGVGGGAFTYRNDAATPLGVAWHNTGSGAGVALQDRFGCCGWQDVNGNRTDVRYVPDTGVDCVIVVTSNTTTTYTPKPGTKPCAPIIISYVQDNLYLAGVAGVVIGVIELVCFLFALFLIIRLCRSPRSRSYD
jgi:hypothetical protein